MAAIFEAPATILEFAEASAAILEFAEASATIALPTATAPLSDKNHAISGAFAGLTDVFRSRSVCRRREGADRT
jgi:hypothetical protein